MGDKMRDTSTFETLGVRSEVVEALSKAGKNHPTPLQRQVLCHTVLDFADLIAEARPANGAHTCMAIFAAHCVLSSPSKDDHTIVLCNNVASCLRMIKIFDGLAIAHLSCQLLKEDSDMSEACRVYVGTLAAIEKVPAEYLRKTVTLVVEDAMAHSAKPLSQMIGRLVEVRQEANLCIFSSQPPSAVDVTIRYLLRRNRRRYLFLEPGAPQYTFLLCQDSADRSDLNVRVSQVTGLKRVLILTHNKEVRDLKAYLHQEVGFRTFAIQRNMQPRERERVLADFLSHQYAVLVAMDAYTGVDLMDVDALIQYYPPQKSMPDEEWSQYISYLQSTGNPASPTFVCTLVGTDDFTMVHYFMKRIGNEHPILNVGPHHPRFADIVRYPNLVAAEKGRNWKRSTQVSNKKLSKFDSTSKVKMRRQ